MPTAVDRSGLSKDETTRLGKSGYKALGSTLKKGNGGNGNGLESIISQAKTPKAPSINQYGGK